MALSKCPAPGCSGSSYAMEDVVPEGAKYKFTFIRCSTCNRTVAVLDWHNIGAQTVRILNQLDELEKRVKRLGG